MPDSKAYFNYLVEHPTVVSVEGIEGERVIKIGGLVEIMRRAGVGMTLNDAEALLSICMWRAYLANETDSATDDTVAVAIPNLQGWLCCLGSYRYIQVKMRVYMNALSTSSCIGFLKELQIHGGSRCLVSKSKFVRGVELSGAPLSRAEAQALAELLMRSKKTSGSRTQKSNKKEVGAESTNSGGGGWSWLQCYDDLNENGSGSGRVSSIEGYGHVEVELLDKVCRGDFLSALL
jgi:hypothetical protein